MTVRHPTFVFVPGAWYVPEHFKAFCERLQNAGYPTVAIKLPSCDPDDPGDHSVGKDAHHILHNAILPELEEGRDIIMFMHSYGACPGSAAAKGHSKGERTAQGLPGGIIGLILVCGYLVSEQEPRLGIRRYLGPWCNVSWNGLVEIDAPGHQPGALLFNRTEMGVGREAVCLLRKQSLQIFETSIPAQAWSSPIYDIRRAYITATEDNMMPYAVQKAMLEKSGKHWDVLRLERGDHSPWLSQPDQVFDFMMEMSRKWTNRLLNP